MQQTSSSAIALRLLALANIVLGLSSVFVISELVMVILGRATYQGQLFLDITASVFGIASVVFGVRNVIRIRTKPETIVLAALFCAWIVLMIFGATRS